MHRVETNLKLSPRAVQALKAADAIAASYNSTEISVEDLLAAAQRIAQLAGQKYGQGE